MEAITCAAIRWINDVGGECIVWGSRKDLSNAHHLIRDFLCDYNPVYGNNLFKAAEQGFYTTEGRFVNRKEALLIATVAKQIIHKQPSLVNDQFNYSYLCSEDLRPCTSPNHEWCVVGESQ